MPNRAGDRWTVVGVVVGPLVLASSFALVHAGQRSMTERSDAIERTYARLAEIHLLDRDVTEAETSARGFALTADDRESARFAHAKGEAERRLARLASLQRADAAGADLLAALDPILHARLAAAEEVIARRRAAGADDVALLAALARGRASMEDLRARLAEVERAERHLLEDRRADLGRAEGALTVRVGVGASLGALLLLAALLALRRESRARGRSEERVRALLEGVPDALLVTDADGVIVRVNAAAERLFDRPREDLVGRPADTLYPERDRAAQVHARVEALGAPGSAAPTSAVRASALRPDGSELPVEVRRSGVRLGGGGALVSAVRDVSARVLLEEERDRFFDLSADLLCIAGFDGHFKDLNPRWEQTLGWSVEELKAKPWLAFVHPDDLDATIEAGRRQTEEGQSVLRLRNRYRRRDGTYRWLEWVSVPSPASGRIYAMARDVTETKESEERIAALVHELEHKNAEAVAAHRELEAFSYSVSHDLRAPLRSIDGFSLALLEDCGDRLDDAGKDHLRRVRAATQRMGVLIDDLLGLSRITRATMTTGRVDLTAVATSVVEELRATQPGRDVTVDVAPDLVATGDVGLLRVVLANLLGNAWKYTGKKPHARIEVFRESAEDGRDVFVVRDDGAGFDMIYVGKLFGVFQRLHGAEEFPGTGVGLATVQQVVRRHGGRVWAEGAVGRGATFRFTLS